MQAATNRHIKGGTQYAHLFPIASGVIKTIKRDATVGDTLSFIKKIVPETLHQTKEIADVLKGSNIYDTCENIWHFVYRHIRYRKDKDGYEQVRSPRRSWADRDKGVDCDCYTTFISSILCNLRIPHILRITKYSKPHFQHIYPIVPLGHKSITIDCVTDKFDYEVPYSEKKDMHMDLQYLDGLGTILPYNSAHDRVINGATEDNEFGELGLFGKKKKKPAENNDAMANPDAVPGTGKKKKKGFFKKLLNVANKVNPVTLALRNGVLVAMKLNIGKIGSRLRWSYLSPNAARAKGIDMPRYQQLVKTRQKLEDIFSNAGGNPANMKKAILKGKGNKDHAVNGLLGLNGYVQDQGIMKMNIYTPLPQLLGPEIYYDENVNGMEGFEGFGELGEPATMASVAAASSVIAAIAASLKKIGDIFKGKKTEGSEDFSEESAAAADTDVAAIKVAAPAAAATNPTTAAAASSFATSDDIESTSSSSSGRTASSGNITTDVSDSSTSGDGSKGFWDKNKKWVIPAGIGVALIGAYVMTRKQSTGQRPASKSLNGPPKPKNHQRKTKQSRKQNGKRKTSIALL